MLPYVCSVIDHRRRQNVISSEVVRELIAECVTDVLTTVILTSSVIHYGTASRQHLINSLCIMNWKMKDF